MFEKDGLLLEEKMFNKIMCFWKGGRIRKNVERKRPERCMNNNSSRFLFQLSQILVYTSPSVTMSPDDDRGRVHR